MFPTIVLMIKGSLDDINKKRVLSKYNVYSTKRAQRKKIIISTKQNKFNLIKKYNKIIYMYIAAV